MRNHRRRIRTWLSIALATVASLALASGASAMRIIDAGTTSVHAQAPVVNNPGGTNWGYVAAGAAVALALLLAAAALTYTARTRSRLAASH